MGLRFGGGWNNVSPAKSNHKKFELFSNQRQNRNVAFLMLLPALLPKMHQPFTIKTRCHRKVLCLKRLLKLMLEESNPFSTTFSDYFVVNFRTFRQMYLGTFLMLQPALPPKTWQLLRRKNHCCVRFLNSEILSDFMLRKNASFWTTF